LGKPFLELSLVELLHLVQSLRLGVVHRTVAAKTTRGIGIGYVKPDNLPLSIGLLLDP